MASLAIALIAQAKEYVIVLKGTSNTIKSNTEVTSKEGCSDTLTVIPARNINEITISIRDVYGNVHQAYYMPATIDDRFSIITPTLPDGYMLEVKDDRGTIYTDFDD